MLCNKKDFSTSLRFARNDKQQLINKLKTNKKISKK